MNTGAAPDTDTILALSGVRFAWRHAARDGDGFTIAIDDFAVTKGETLLLMGPSGSGKSTLLSLICGIARPDTGAIRVVDTDIARLRGAACDRFRADHFGIIFQMFNLLPYASLLDNVILPLSFSPARRRRTLAQGPVDQEARRLLTRLGLGDALSRRATAQLSVGQQQRVAVARALIGQPDLVVADEPTSALDRDRQHAFLTLLFEEVARAGATLIMVSHDETLAPMFDRTLRLDHVARTS